MQTSTSRKPLELKISTIVAVCAILRDAKLDVLEASLKEMTGGADDYFDDEFTVIDIAALEAANTPIDWPRLIALFKSYRLNPVAVRNAPQEIAAEILAYGLSLDVVSPSGQKTAEIIEPTETAAPAPASTPAISPVQQTVSSKVMIVDTPVRAGQRIYARGSDLVVTAAVNNGAEVIADGNIHVYAPLRGRALAGASGDDTARIFTLCMEAELVSIAGIYRTFENDLTTDLLRQPAQVSLLNEHINIQALNLFK